MGLSATKLVLALRLLVTNQAFALHHFGVAFITSFGTFGRSFYNKLSYFYMTTMFLWLIKCLILMIIILKPLFCFIFFLKADQNRIKRKQLPLYGVEGRFERINQHPVMFLSSIIRFIRLFFHYNYSLDLICKFFLIITECGDTFIFHWSHWSFEHKSLDRIKRRRYRLCLSTVCFSLVKLCHLRVRVHLF